MQRALTPFVTAVLLALTPMAAAETTVALPEPLDPGGFQAFDEKRAELGRLLFYDKVLSGNRNISCGTCHNHDHGSSDGLSLGVGEGGIGLGPDRRIPKGRDHPLKRVPRNANALFNLGHEDFRVLFHDGRASLEDAYGNGFNTPAEEWLPNGLTSITAAQAMFPLTSTVEMAGNADENDIGAARRERIDHVWPKIAQRVAAIPEYVARFRRAYDNIETPGDIEMIHIANAIGDFIIGEWRSDDSPFDRHLRGAQNALTEVQLAGLVLFYGKAGCARCHSGPLLTDQKFHALALPPLGPGRTRSFDPFPRDVGRMAETDRLEDAYRFRTPSLRNVAETGPYGHNGAYADLEGIVRHHLDPLTALNTWDRSQTVLPASDRFAATDFVIWEDTREMARLRARVDIEPIELTDREVNALVAFLKGLSDPAALRGRLGKPEVVPSGLPID
ncbi:cytochrome-c peroxidase [Oricola cellulosilytica]|uniref:Methylamine utilization protein MauG n=1 Tax=Oricola cellulosilytica TaxID=1429082 RepID=A0A4V2MP33_9HYPH|nr:cytochrome c peroxidase [Oricola cellulosilytica]TCD16112.1 methylamine utilization protein MauG [Oricola cellulosilytica]